MAFAYLNDEVKSVCFTFNVKPESHLTVHASEKMFSLAHGPTTILQLTQLPLNRIKLQLGTSTSVIKKGHLDVS